TSGATLCAIALSATLHLLFSHPRLGDDEEGEAAWTLRPGTKRDPVLSGRARHVRTRRSEGHESQDRSDFSGRRGNWSFRLPNADARRPIRLGPKRRGWRG